MQGRSDLLESLYGQMLLTGDAWLEGAGGTGDLGLLALDPPLAENRPVITSYSIHYTKLYEMQGYMIVK